MRNGTKVILNGLVGIYERVLPSGKMLVRYGEDMVVADISKVRFAGRMGDMGWTEWLLMLVGIEQGFLRYQTDIPNTLKENCMDIRQLMKDKCIEFLLSIGVGTYAELNEHDHEFLTTLFHIHKKRLRDPNAEDLTKRVI